MRINTQEDPDMTEAKVWLNGVEVGTADSPYRLCFEADDEAGYIKCSVAIEVSPGRFRPVEGGEDVIHYGTVVIQLPEATQQTSVSLPNQSEETR